MVKIWLDYLDYLSVDWDNLLKNDELTADNSTSMYLDKINMLLDICAPLKRINKYRLKFKSKLRITLGSQKSISMKNKFLAYFINKKDPNQKRNLILTTENIEIYSPLLWREVNRLTMINILKQIAIMFRTLEKESNTLFLQKLYVMCQLLSPLILLRP